MRRPLLSALAGLVAGCAAPLQPPEAFERPLGPTRAGELIVRWVEAPVPAAITAIGGAAIGETAGRSLVRVTPGSEVAACRALRAWPGVASAEPNRVVRTQQVGVIRPARGLMRALNDEAFRRPSPVAGQAATWGLREIRAEEAWEVTSGEGRVTVAVIDTGVDRAHPDLAANLAAGSRNLVEQGQPPDDDFGHGTHVAGIVAAVGDNNVGASGVAYRAKVLPIRVLGVDGTGTTWNTIAAIEYAVERGCSVINMSLGSPDYSPAEAEAVRKATEAGALVVAAAGNEAADGNYLEYPASYPNVVSVAAVGPDLKRAPFSNYNSWVTISAPGVDIFSTIPTRMSPQAPYGYLSGTSMAAPMVAGAAALLFARNPSYSPAQVADRLKRTARDLSPAGDPVQGFDVYFGAGLLDAGRALGR